MRGSSSGSPSTHYHSAAASSQFSPRIPSHATTMGLASCGPSQPAPPMVRHSLIGLLGVMQMQSLRMIASPFLANTSPCLRAWHIAQGFDWPFGEDPLVLGLKHAISSNAPPSTTHPLRPATQPGTPLKPLRHCCFRCCLLCFLGHFPPRRAGHQLTLRP
ncbi:hypothetical protein BS47DRAFT_1086463 [Hydnum rufescens UP504]|uniref:Uncharacterized protein n=1 Tax=Hydnum rufescens UP504 TaxID=1448309 RepID=A0A9P6B8K2_9AGAM|nr:hypothetical protein BS47DRAFT_1086463 [Hydnum rufescens UP504]